MSLYAHPTAMDVPPPATAEPRAPCTPSVDPLADTSNLGNTTSTNLNTTMSTTVGSCGWAGPTAPVAMVQQQPPQQQQATAEAPSTDISTRAFAAASAHQQKLNLQERNVYISGLPDDMRPAAFRAMCEVFGKVESSKLSLHTVSAPDAPGVGGGSPPGSPATRALADDPAARGALQPRTLCKGYGFVLFCREESAAAFILEMNGKMLQGKQLQVRRADLTAAPQHVEDHRPPQAMHGAGPDWRPSAPYYDPMRAPLPPPPPQQQPMMPMLYSAPLYGVAADGQSGQMCGLPYFMPAYGSQAPTAGVPAYTYYMPPPQQLVYVSPDLRAAPWMATAGYPHRMGAPAFAPGQPEALPYDAAPGRPRAPSGPHSRAVLGSRQNSIGESFNLPVMPSSSSASTQATGMKVLWAAAGGVPQGGPATAEYNHNNSSSSNNNNNNYSTNSNNTTTTTINNYNRIHNQNFVNTTSISEPPTTISTDTGAIYENNLLTHNSRNENSASGKHEQQQHPSRTATDHTHTQGQGSNMIFFNPPDAKFYMFTPPS